MAQTALPSRTDTQNNVVTLLQDSNHLSNKRRHADAEYAAISEFLSTIDQSAINDVDENGSNTQEDTSERNKLASQFGIASDMSSTDGNSIVFPARKRLRACAPVCCNESFQLELESFSSPQWRDENILSKSASILTESGLRERNSLHLDPPTHSSSVVYEFDASTKTTETSHAFGDDVQSYYSERPELCDTSSPHYSTKVSIEHPIESRIKATFCSISRHTKLTELEHYVRELERDNLHLKQSLLTGKAAKVFPVLDIKDATDQDLKERIRIVESMVHQLNGNVLQLQNVARVWHPNCRIGIGIREWNANGHHQLINLWRFIQSLFVHIVIDIIELRPHFVDGEMILTKWRVQGEIADSAQLEALYASDYCSNFERILSAVKSCEVTFTVTTYITFEKYLIAQQYHNWDQVGVLKRLFGGQLPSAIFNCMI